MPKIVNVYNSKKGGVDQIDQLLSYYRIFIKLKNGRFDFYCIWLICWQEYRKIASKLGISSKESKHLLDFRENVTDALVHANKLQIMKLALQHDRIDNTSAARRPSTQQNPRPDTASHYEFFMITWIIGQYSSIKQIHLDVLTLDAI